MPRGAKPSKTSSAKSLHSVNSSKLRLLLLRRLPPSPRPPLPVTVPDITHDDTAHALRHTHNIPGLRLLTLARYMICKRRLCRCRVSSEHARRESTSSRKGLGSLSADKGKFHKGLWVFSVDLQCKTAWCRVWWVDGLVWTGVSDCLFCLVLLSSPSFLSFVTCSWRRNCS